jgi:PAS domain S-box-containing protein
MNPNKIHTNLVVAFCATVLTAFLFLFLFFNIGIKNRKYTYEDSKTLAKEISRKAANETEVYISSALLTARSVTEKAVIYKKLGGTREDIIQLLLDALDKNRNIMGAWTMWEPNAFDKRDKFFRKDTLYDINGTMSIAFFNYKKNSYYERNDPADFNEDFYTIPRLTRKELILDPFHYQYHGHDFVFYQTSAVVPVIIDSTFMGVFGVDINLDSLQHKINSVRLYETGFLSLITGSGIIVTHIDTTLIDKNFFSLLDTTARKRYKAINQGQELTIETTSKFSGKKVFRFFYPFQVGSGVKPWYIMVEIPIDKATVRSRQLLIVAYGALILGLFLLLYLIINIFDRRRYEKNILESMNKVEESNRIVSVSEAKFRSIFENANDAILIMNGNTIIECNFIATEMFGCEKEQLIGKTPDAFSPSTQQDGISSKEKALLKINAAIEDGPQRFEWQHNKLNGTTFDVEVSLNSFLLDEQLFIMAVVRDITARKKSEEALKKSEERLQHLVDSLTDYIYTVKINDDKVTETIHGEGCTAVTGYTPQEFQADPHLWIKIVHEDDKQLVREYVDRLQAGVKSAPLEHRIIHKEGKIKWVRNTSVLRFNVQQEAISYDGLISDITDRKQAEEALIGSERKFRNIFDKTKHGILIVGQDLRILAANKAASELSAYEFSDNDPLYVTDFLAADQQKIVSERLIFLLNGEKLEPVEHRVKTKDGQIRIMTSESSVMEYYGQEAFLVMFWDVTHIRNAEHKVLEAIIATEENERGRIAQDLHDGLGPVLSTIKIYFQVYEDTKDSAKRTILAEKLESTIEEAIKGISEISHNISPHILKNYGFYAALKQFIHRIEITNVIKISFECSSEPYLNQNSEIILYRAITELINNSIKHSGCKNISIRLRESKDFIIIDYKDDGRGFNVASVIDKPSQGSGMHNIISRIKALRGTVEINSNKDKGMKASFRIPV